MESLFVRVLTLSLTGSAVLLPLLLLAPRLRGRYAAGTLSVLWLVLALRMALPVPLSLPWTAVTVDVSALSSVTLPAAPRAPAEVPEPAGPESVEPPRAVPPAAAPEGRPLPLLELAAWVWLAGGLALAGYQGAAYLLARRRLLRGAQPGTEEERAQLAALAAELGLRRTPRLLRTGEADAPLVVGLGRPVLLLPHPGAVLRRPCGAGEGRSVPPPLRHRPPASGRRRAGAGPVHPLRRGRTVAAGAAGESVPAQAKGGGGGRPRAGCRPGRHLTGGL